VKLDTASENATGWLVINQIHSPVYIYSDYKGHVGHDLD